MWFFASPTNLAIGSVPRKDGKEVIGGGVSCYPFCTEEILIESCDALGRCSEPTIGESCGGYTRCSALRFWFAR